MTPPSRHRTFFWQAMFILLPVTLMAAFGFWAILHQRRMVEQDAQTRAQEFLRGLPGDFGQRVAGELTQMEVTKAGWLTHLETLARWPADPKRQLAARRHKPCLGRTSQPGPCDDGLGRFGE